jgi:hypothetical protein
MSRSILPTPLALTFITLAGCGGGDRPSSRADEAPAPDTLVQTLTREALTEADLVGFTMMDVSVELPWTTNRVRRGGSERAARARLQSVDLSSHETFDRAFFQFTDATPFPGYEIELTEAAQCGESAVDMAGDRFLSIRFEPARAREGNDVSVPVGTRAVAQPRFQEAGLVCEDDRGLSWVAALAEGAQVRAFELRAPNRLVVDVR